MDLTAEKAKRDARIKAKEERIKDSLGTAQAAPVEEVKALAEPAK
jgi:hypothetical protein